MTDQILPDWIRKRKAEKDAASLKAENAVLRNQLAASRILADGPAFWKELLIRLHVATEGLASIGFKGTVSEIGPYAVQATVTRQSNFPDQRYVNVFYDRPGSPVIRCVPQEGHSYELCLTLSGDKLAIQGDQGPMNSEDTAAHILEPLVVALES